ncbi:MAG: pre-peptidase C-terminal domain-containing protein [Chloroflexi bacterium]|nr:pre-peptidase C-terminal domain-containing protein [Chloroflexota bacterium]
MRSFLVFTTVLMVALLGAAAWVGAQDSGDVQPTATAGNAWVPVVPNDAEAPEFTMGDPTAVNPLNGMVLALVPMSPDDVRPASNFCSSARSLSLIPLTVPAASQTNVASFTTSADDPALTCMWGSNPPSSQGFRTAWYQFTTDYNGLVTINTRTSAYDTILGVFTGSCGAALLLPVACNDDTSGLASEVTFAVQRGVTYYVEVADWQPGALGSTLLLNLQAAYVTPLVSNWTNVGFVSAPAAPVSRHATAVVGSDIYMVGGLTTNSFLTNGFYRYQTTNNTWTALNPIPGSGFVNTTAAYVDATQRIYVPGGSISAQDSAYSNLHWLYDVSGGFWQQAAAVPLSSGQPFAYATAVANDSPAGYYLLGGIEGPGWPLTNVVTDTNTIRDDVLFYTPASNTWTTWPSLNASRYGHTAARIGGRICVAGGFTWNPSGTLPVALLTTGECADASTPTAWINTGDMQIPRYFAHGAVGPDGRWYVYGGIDVNGKAVPEVEFYDPTTNSWYLLDYLYDLNNRQPGEPALTWPRGGFVGNTLWALGGSFDYSGNSPNPLIKKMAIPIRGNLYLPVVASGSPENFTFATAHYLPLAQVRSQNIASATDRHRFYQINLSQGQSIRIDLTVPSGEDLDLYLYDGNKVIWGVSDAPFQGVAEQICLRNLQAGSYFIMVQHVIPNVPDSSKQFQAAVWPVAGCP